MRDFNNEEDIGRLLKSAYQPVVPSPELKNQVLERLTLEVGAAVLSASRPIWERPKLWAPIVAAVISGIIGYGVWLSLNVPPTLLP